jgi:hypothetical protein
MTTHTATSRGNGADYHYYPCKQRKGHRQACDREQRAVRTTEAEGRVWAFVAGLLRDPGKVRRGIERLVEEERMPPTRNPEREVGEWSEQIAACDRRRSVYQYKRSRCNVHGATNPRLRFRVTVGEEPEVELELV